MQREPGFERVPFFVLAALLAACGGGSGPPPSAPPPPPPPASDPLVRVSQATPFGANCNGAPQSGTLQREAEVEPHLAVNPASPANLVAMWQQDRWDTGGAQGLVVAASFDGGESWTLSTPRFSRCAGGNPGNGGDYERTTDPWVAVSPDGTAHALALAFNGAVLAAGSASAMLVARSLDGGLSWSGALALIADGADAFNDKGTITADPGDSRLVYAVWDRLQASGAGPAWFARTLDGGLSWEAARSIYDPGPDDQTIGNQIFVLPDGALVNLFTQIHTAPSGAVSATLRVIRSKDRGDTWAAPVTVSDLLAVGTVDPDTGAPVRDGAILGAGTVDRGGVLYVVWQDARFSGGRVDGIALARSTDGGATWSAPQGLNGEPGAAAFTPSVHVRSDGAIGVSYYDLRSNTSASTTLPADYWLAVSTDAVNWIEAHISGPFDLALAPGSQGLFLGDYQVLASDTGRFLPFFVQTNARAANPTDAYVAFSTPALAGARGAGAEARRAAAAQEPVVVSPQWQARVEAAIRARMARRLPPR